MTTDFAVGDVVFFYGTIGKRSKVVSISQLDGTILVKSLFDGQEEIVKSEKLFKRSLSRRYPRRAQDRIAWRKAFGLEG